MRERQIADPQAEWTTELGHTEEERGRMREREEREMFCVCACASIYMCVRSSVTLNEAIID